MPEKTFVNTSSGTLQITIFVRQDDIPYLNSSTVSFELLPGETETVVYGDELNPFLNGLILFTINAGDLYSKVQFITALGTELDTLLNTNDTLIFEEVQTDYVLTGSNTGNPLLDLVNAALTVPQIQAAISNPELGLNLTAYLALTPEQQDAVALEVLINRPVTGYPDVASLQVVLNAAIGQIVG